MKSKALERYFGDAYTIAPAFSDFIVTHRVTNDGFFIQDLPVIKGFNVMKITKGPMRYKVSSVRSLTEARALIDWIVSHTVS